MTNDDRPYRVKLECPDGNTLLISEYGGGVSIPEDIAEDLHLCYAKHRESRGFKTAHYSDDGEYCV